MVTSMMYGSPVPQLRRLATATSFQSALPDFRSVALDATYSAAFAAPCLQCVPISQADLKAFRHLMAGDLDDHAFTYVFWTQNSTSKEPPVRVDIEDGAPTISYIDFFYPTEVLNCSLYHASYTMNIAPVGEFKSTVKAWSVESHDAMASLPEVTDLEPGQPPSDHPLASDYGYLANLQCIADVLKGYMRDKWAAYEVFEIESDIARTSVAFTHEMLQSSRTRGLEGPPDDEESIYTQRTSDTPWPDEAFEASTFNRPLSYGIEQLFQNVTLSLHSKSTFLTDTGQPTNVTLNRWVNVYAYDAKTLWTSYGVALALTLLVCLAGCTTIYHNEASYSNLVSTVLRTTRNLGEFDSMLIGHNQTGADPLPTHLSRACIQLGLYRLTEHNYSHGSLIELSQRPQEVVDEEDERIAP